MSNKILVVESDASQTRALATALTARGFDVDETTDGKGLVELVRRERPGLVVLAVDLSAGQNGYLLCGKLKKDDELRSIPVVILGNPDKFAEHRKLKAHADDYVAKPVDLDALIDAAGTLIGFPPQEETGLSELEEPVSAEFGAEEIAVDSADATLHGDPELDMLDAAFEDISEPVAEEPVAGEEDALSALDAEPFETTVDEEPQELGAMVPLDDFSSPPPPPAPVAFERRAPLPADGGELRTLRARVSELESALSDVQSDASASSDRVRELESELESRTTELETVRASGGKSDKDTFALRDAANKKDKEILRLKAELHAKDEELVELRDREMQLEQSASGTAEEMARRDAQIRTLTGKTDQLTNEKKRTDQQLATAKDEARAAAARASALQEEVDQFHAQHESLSSEADALRSRVGDLEAELTASRSSAQSVQSELDGARNELDTLRQAHEELQGELATAHDTSAREAARHGEELEELRRRATELEETIGQHEERVAKLYGRIKNDEKLRDRTKKALAVALQLLEEQPEAVEGGDSPDEEAVA